MVHSLGMISLLGRLHLDLGLGNKDRRILVRLLYTLYSGSVIWSCVCICYHYTHASLSSIRSTGRRALHESGKTGSFLLGFSLHFLISCVCFEFLAYFLLLYNKPSYES